MSGSRPSCLIILSAAIEGVSAQSFIQAFTLTQTVFNVQIVSPNGRPAEFVRQDDNSRRWLNEFCSQPVSTPLMLESVDPTHYGCIIIPDAPGAVNDLATSKQLANIITYLMGEKKPICAIGMGVAALSCLGGETTNKWRFADYSMTATSLYELARMPYFGNIPIIPEDYIKDNGAKYTSSEPDEVHIVLDRNLITGQNTASTYMAIQMFILLVNQRFKKTSI